MENCEWYRPLNTHLGEENMITNSENCFIIFPIDVCGIYFNSSPPNAACMRQWIGYTLVQVIDCLLFGAKPLPEPMLANCQQILVKFE